MADLLPYLIGGLANGALYSLLALGFVLVYRATSVVNFAIGIFSPAIHALRLHYVEFFGQFFSPGGTRYRPFGHWRPSS